MTAAGTHWVTGLFIIVCILAIAAYDFYAYSRWGSSGTVSEVLHSIGDSWPLFPYLVAFAMGVLFGHFFLGLPLR
jgi:hypothetical protein